MVRYYTHSLIPLSALFVAMLLGTIPTAAQAWYYGGYGYPYGSHGYGYGYSRGYGYGGHRNRHRYRSSGNYSGHRYGSNAGHGYDSNGCHSTSKNGNYDGYKGKIGGTMCYDDYGEAYIVPGSRHLIEAY